MTVVFDDIAGVVGLPYGADWLEVSERVTVLAAIDIKDHDS
ncbi:MULTISPECIES: hypothetical protein [unclassified Nocardia]|nr:MULTISPECIES: hypothetical protein [unclassified Nocardia]